MIRHREHSRLSSEAISQLDADEYTARDRRGKFEVDILGDVNAASIQVRIGTF